MGYGAGGATADAGRQIGAHERSVDNDGGGRPRGELVAGDASGGPSRWRTAVSALCRVLTPLYVKTLV